MDQSQRPDHPLEQQQSHAIWLVLPILITALLCFASSVRSQEPVVPTPTIDRLAIPVVPDNPTPIDLGRKVYYLNCMPCHGDVGQGLTDEWRNVWEADHRNCWAKGCHGGRVEDQGYPLPRTIPAVIGPEADLQRYTSSDELVAYLQQTHPPQRPGALAKEEYEDVTAFLWHENQRDKAVVHPALFVIIAGVLAIVALVIVLRYRARRMDHNNAA